MAMGSESSSTPTARSAGSPRSIWPARKSASASASGLRSPRTRPKVHAQYRAEARAGQDPRDLRKPVPEEEQTFEALFWGWFEAKAPGWKDYHAYQTRNIGNLHVVPLFGKLVPAKVRPIDVKRIITPLMQEKPTTGHKVLGIVSRVFRYAVALDIVPSDPCRDLRGAVPPKPGVKHRAALTDPAEIGELMWGVANFPFSSLVIRQALRFAALTAARPKEVVMASWKEIDLDAVVWIIPPERMKRGREHRVPLSRQALELLREQKAAAGDSPWVFPSPRGRGRSLSSNAALFALREMGWEKEKMTMHGFRGMFSTTANESGLWGWDLVETQLSHEEKNAVRATCNHAEYFKQRAEMMQWYADWLDARREEAACRKRCAGAPSPAELEKTDAA